MFVNELHSMLVYLGRLVVNDGRMLMCPDADYAKSRYGRRGWGRGPTEMAEVSVASADPAKAADVRNIIRTAMDTYKLRAVIVRVTIDGEDVITEAFGSSMTGVAASTDMHFRNGSVAESYIANVLLQLVDQKQISLDGKLSKWLPDLPHADEVSLGNLISMTSGYRDFVPDPEFLKVNDTQPYKTWTPEEILPYAHLDLPLLYPPGTNWNYAHTNFVILGMALDRITGQPLNKVLQDKVLGPLGLTNTTDPVAPSSPSPCSTPGTPSNAPSTTSRRACPSTWTPPIGTLRGAWPRAPSRLRTSMTWTRRRSPSGTASCSLLNRSRP